MRSLLIDRNMKKHHVCTGYSILRISLLELMETLGPLSMLLITPIQRQEKQSQTIELDCRKNFAARWKTATRNKAEVYPRRLQSAGGNTEPSIKLLINTQSAYVLRSPLALWPRAQSLPVRSFKFSSIFFLSFVEKDGCFCVCADWLCVCVCV